MRRRLLLLSMLALFGLAYATLDRVPRATLAVLRGGGEHVLRLHEAEAATGPVD
jgi:hypothetical protein